MGSRFCIAGWTFLSLGSNNVGCVAGVAGVEDAAEFVVAAEEGVGLIDEQGGAHFFDHAEEGGRADVCSRNWTICEPAQNAEQRGFATTFFRRFDAKVRADVAQFEGVGMEYPERKSLGREVREDDEALKEGLQIVEKEGTILDFGFWILD